MNNKNIKIVDEHSIDRNASVMFAFDLDGSEYVAYWIERDEDNGNIFVSKIIKNIDSTFSMLDIDDFMEKGKLSDIVKHLITTAINDESDKLNGTSLTLTDGKMVNFIAVSFNKEQRINVQKTYITTVKKEVTRVTEKYYDVVVKDEQPKIFVDIFPPVSPVVENKFEDVKPVVSTVVENNVVNEDVSVIEPVISEPVLSVPVVDVTNNVVSQTIPTIEPVVVSNAEVLSPVPTVVEPITVAEPVSSVQAKDEILAFSQSEVVNEPVENSSSIVESANTEVQPLVFNASKETNLNAALGEVANSSSIPVENIEPIREFGVDDASTKQVVVEPAVQEPVESQVIAGNKSGFANNKFFVVVAVVFFLASCVFLGYEVYNYFQLTK